jgi:type I restriction enzyme S subunit
MKLISSADTLGFLCASAPRPWIKRMLSRSNLGKVLVPVPPKADQDALIDRLGELSAQVEEVAALQTTKLTHFAELKQSLLARAFAGELV